MSTSNWSADQHMHMHRGRWQPIREEPPIIILILFGLVFKILFPSFFSFLPFFSTVRTDSKWRLSESILEEIWNPFRCHPVGSSVHLIEQSLYAVRHVYTIAHVSINEVAHVSINEVAWYRTKRTADGAGESWHPVRILEVT